MAEAAPYQVLARKYRPRSFDEVVGQSSVVSTLKNAIGQGRLHHAYLFSGTRGVGKTTLARLFARALNCATGPTVDPCGSCDPCREIAAGNAMDVIEIDGASNRKVEDVDPLREAARYAPARDRHKIFIVDEVHMLSETAFNALLKILEEPPPRVLFLFATTEPEQVPDTIMSRCLHLACRRVGRQEIADALGRTAGLEKVEGSAEAFDLIAGLAAGSVRDGLSLLDQVIAFSGGQVTPAGVREALGLIDRGIVMEFIEAIGRHDAAGTLAIVERLSEAGADLTHFAREALARVRDVMVCKAAGARAAAALSMSPEEGGDAGRLAELFSQDALLRLIHAMLDLADRIRRDEQPRFLLEAAALRMIRLADLAPIEDLLRRIEGIAPVAATAPRLPKPTAAPPASSGPSGPRNGGLGGPAGGGPPSSSRAESPQPAASREATRLLQRLSDRKVSLAAFLNQARGLRLEGDAFIVTIQPKQGFIRAALESPENLEVIREEASALLGRPAVVRVEEEALAADDLSAVEGGQAGDDASRRRERLIDEALKEPAVRAVMDMFKGQIVDIREGH
ncbi:MAG TPA: DNA polymerase III subunit gamma/tau [Candidatus Polarisedimenticolia bacterium]|jgi:DNA polymerase-3 subunit gamma/tau